MAQREKECTFHGVAISNHCCSGNEVVQEISCLVSEALKGSCRFVSQRSMPAFLLRLYEVHTVKTEGMPF